ncbi:MAG: APC family permease [Oscillospiraceae bacterium]|nr:APC family permease [Oscillospiraceae bacterium]
MENKLSLRQLVWIGTGHVIGAGVVSIVGSRLAETGYSVWIGFLVACILSFVRILPVVMFTSAVTVEGGRYGIITRCAGMQYGGLITLSCLLNWSRRGTAVLALRRYISDFLPCNNSKLLTLTIWFIFCTANLFGLDVMSRIQSIATPMLVVALSAFSVICILNMQPGYIDFSKPEMFSGGIGGFFTAVVLLSYSCDGIASMANYATKTENPRKIIPVAMITVSAITTAVYVAVGFASGAVLPLELTAGKTLTVTAKAVLSPLFYNLFIIFGPVFALLTTMNAGIMDSALPVMAGVKEGWLPVWLAKQNRYGAYYVAISIIAAIGAIPVITGISVSQIASITMALGALSAVLMIISAVNFPFVFKEEWEHSWMYIPAPHYFTIVFICAVLELFVVIQSLLALTPIMAVMNIVLVLICSVYGYMKSKKYKADKKRIPVRTDVVIITEL